MRKAGRVQAAVLAATIGAGLAGLPGEAKAAGETGWRVGSVVATALYAPAKVLYAATGVIAGGIGWGVSGGDRQAMDAVMTPALQGDYIVTPEHLRGERRLEFFGAGPDAPEPSLAGSEDPESQLDEFYFDY